MKNLTSGNIRSQLHVFWPYPSPWRQYSSSSPTTIPSTPWSMGALPGGNTFLAILLPVRANTFMLSPAVLHRYCSIAPFARLHARRREFCGKIFHRHQYAPELAFTLYQHREGQQPHAYFPGSRTGRVLPHRAGISTSKPFTAEACSNALPRNFTRCILSELREISERALFLARRRLLAERLFVALCFTGSVAGRAYRLSREFVCCSLRHLTRRAKAACHCFLG